MATRDTSDRTRRSAPRQAARRTDSTRSSARRKQATRRPARRQEPTRKRATSGQQRSGRRQEPTRRQESERRSERETVRSKSILPVIAVLAVLLVAGVVGGVMLWGSMSGQSKQGGQAQTELTPEQQAEQQAIDRAHQVVDSMTLEQKVGQLFVVRPEALTGVEAATEAGSTTRDAIAHNPIGGLVYTDKNMVDAKQLKSLIKSTQNYVKDATGLPALMCIEEEGGPHGPLAKTYLSKSDVDSASLVGASNDTEKARDAARTIGEEVSSYGFNVNLAPDADIVTSLDSDLSDRSFGDDPAKVADMTAAQIDGYLRSGLLCAVKHFPGVGEAEADPHNARRYSHRSASELQSREMVPFAAAVEADVPMVMVSNMSCLAVGNGEGDVPSWMSTSVVQDLLRKDLGFTGVAITDFVDDESVSEACDASEQGVRAIKAGMDVVLCPQDYERAYKGLLKAVEDGDISEDRIDESVTRIVRLKQSLAD